MRSILKRVVFLLFMPVSRWYFSKSRWYRYRDIRVRILPGVFIPFFTFSTKALLKVTDQLPLKGRTFLELGSGSGVISVLAAKRGGQVTACDINPKAVENTLQNASLNNVQFRILRSDLFGALQGMKFDIIIINPPYYPKQPANTTEKAWYCGENFEYFDRLFAQLPDHIDQNSKVLMILSEDCDIEQINSLANKYQLKMKEIHAEKSWWETNYLFNIQHS